ncbi:uncharacterized protein LOC5517588 [Nematostella vectensis]|uniref:uncharacterized protein LOC5517588 n=1 Tax=Nematostella vectensis TaxID=45351 RepID=UPI002077672E|nr:uncharacterized protein LOC5517588 [Nematostella vectensis]
MPMNHRGDPNLLKETVTRIVYRSEYRSNYTGTENPLQNIRLHSRFMRKPAWESDQKPGTSRMIQVPLRSRPTKINLQGLEPNPQMFRSKSASYSQNKALSVKSFGSSRPYSGLSATSRAQTEQFPQRLVARRIQSQLSRFPKEFRYIDKQCFFHPAQKPRKTFFVISPDWVSEKQQNHIRKNNVFG